MIGKKQRIWCCIVACLVLLAGIYTTYGKADSLAKPTAIIGTSVRDEIKPMQKLMQVGKVSIQECMYLTPQVTNRIGELIGRLTVRSSSIRRDLRLLVPLLLGIITAYFILRYFREEVFLCLHEKEYWTALIKYIHDIDGKKKMACLI